MNPSDYLKAALRTEHTPDFVRLAPRVIAEPDDRSKAEHEHDVKVARLLHALLGIMSEAGELADALKKHIVYRAQLDEINLIEENGDLSWYQSLLLSACNASWEVSWQKNIDKLRVRFPDAFTHAQALNRDLDAERRALEGQGLLTFPNGDG